MKILILADAVVPVPPTTYGGTERVVDMICRGLVQRGHEVHLVAAPGSRDYGGGLTIHRAPTAAYLSRAARKLWFQIIVLRAAAGVDVVINHGRLDYLEILYRTRKPVIHWFHNPLNGNEVDYITSRRKHGDYFVGISQSHISAGSAVSRFTVVHNAVNIAVIPFSSSPAAPPYLLFLGRLTHNKGVHLAINAAERAGMKLVIGGNISHEAGGVDYFNASIKPRLGPACAWIGPYDEATRVKLVAGATALLFPIQWQEPFGLVMIEALAAGVPVIASRIASTPEVVVHGETGFLCESEDEMVGAIQNVGKISRAQCRASVEERFSEPVFMGKVEQLIRRAVAAKS